MIKNKYDKVNKHYRHDYYCDNCFKEITFCKIYRQELALQAEKYDLCWDCKDEWDKKQKKWGDFE